MPFHSESDPDYSGDLVCWVLLWLFCRGELVGAAFWGSCVNSHVKRQVCLLLAFLNKRGYFFFSTPLARLTNKMLSLEKGRHTYINKLIYKTNQEANIAEEKEELQVSHGGGRVEKVTTEDEKGH